jgi:cytochrome c oxidase subunit 2
MATTEPPADAPAVPRLGLRMFAVWIVLALAADLVIWFVWYPHLPPGDMSDAASASTIQTANMRRPCRGSAGA